MHLRHKAAKAASTTVTTAALICAAGTAAAQSTFQGRDAFGLPSATCTATGPGKCSYFYDTTLDITILNNWNIGTGPWSASGAPGSAQALAASAVQSAGLSANLLPAGQTGWVLPTGDLFAPAGAQNQYTSIWDRVGGGFAGLSGQFDGVQTGTFWSGTAFAPSPGFAWVFGTYFGPLPTDFEFFAVAVRPGDVAAVSAVPEPQTYALMLAGLGVVGYMARRRRAGTAGAGALPAAA